MTDKEALKVLESWLRLAYHNADGTDEDSAELYEALKTTFALIGRQKVEIERLQTNREHSKLIIQKLKEKILVAKAEAVKEFDELLKEDCLSYPLEKDDITMLVDVKSYNNLLKEMVGE